METCYMCNATKTSMEHVPPKCIFPEKKDSPNSKDYRQELIKVPSCDTHNSGKSKEDEFFLMYMASIATTSEAASLHQKTKLFRILDRKPHVWLELLKHSKPASIIDKNGVTHQTCIFQIDSTRVFTQFDHIARGLYFHPLKKNGMGMLKFHSPMEYRPTIPPQIKFTERPLQSRMVYFQTRKN